MGLLDMFDKLDDIVYEPIKLLTDWAREPLRIWEDKRKRKREIEKMKVEAENRIKERRAEVELEIKKETEIKKILVEIEEFKKDKEFERMKAVSEAIIKYKETLTKINIEAIEAIGNMQLDLRNKAQQLVYEKTVKYKELQDLAIKEAEEDLKRIEKDFSNNETARKILINAIDRRLANIIDTAHNFLIELNSDIKLINQNISLLTERSQNFIENHLQHFHITSIANANEELKRIEYKNDD